MGLSSRKVVVEVDRYELARQFESLIEPHALAGDVVEVGEERDDGTGVHNGHRRPLGDRLAQVAPADALRESEELLVSGHPVEADAGLCRAGRRSAAVDAPPAAHGAHYLAGVEPGTVHPDVVFEVVRQRQETPGVDRPSLAHLGGKLLELARATRVILSIAKNLPPAGRLLVFFEFLDAHSGVQVADFDGDGLLDVIAGRFWERIHWEDQPRFHGRLYKNVGTKTHPRFEPRDAYHGAPYTEGFQPCDAVRQNQVRAFDWNGDGRTDLIAGDTDGRVWLFRNTTDNLAPVFAPGERMTAAGKPIRRIPNTNFLGYAKTEIADWNNDGRPDLLVLDSGGLVALYLNEGTRTQPKLGPGVDLVGGQTPVQLPQFGGGICVCDWNSDGKKDLVGSSDAFYYYENTGTDAMPVLAAAKRIKFGPTDDGQTSYWIRPSAGSFLDWDGDGDLDILTGQGHGGSGLRFFEHDYVMDCVNKTFPRVSVGEVRETAEPLDILSIWRYKALAGAGQAD